MSYDINYFELGTDEERKEFVGRLNRKGRKELEKEILRRTNMNNEKIFDEKHPCLCDKCLTARDLKVVARCTWPWSR
jgi:hypothetical protein